MHDAGGVMVVPMNQTQNGGRWNLLGTFSLEPVVADAVVVVSSGASNDHVTYTPTRPRSGRVGIYAKWTETATMSNAKRTFGYLEKSGKIASQVSYRVFQTMRDPKFSLPYYSL